MNLNRRHILAGAALLLLWPHHVFAAESPETEAMLGLLPDREAAAKLGGLWVSSGQAQPAEILESLRPRLRWSVAVNPGTFRHNLANAVGDDFRSGRVVKVEGWQLAQTQAELCALAYFAAEGLV